MCVLPTLLAVRWQRQLGEWPGEWKRGSSNQRECVHVCERDTVCV